MPHLLVLQEYGAFGAPVWEFAVSRSEIPHVYAPVRLGEQNTDERSWISKEKILAWVTTRRGHWSTLDLARFGSHEYGLYLPQSEQALSWLCRATTAHGGCVEVVVPSALAPQAACEFTPIWGTTRPLRYLSEGDLCRTLGIPWLYLLAIYNYAPCVSVFVADSPQMVKQVIQLTSGITDCTVIPLEKALEVEQKNWESVYRRFEQFQIP